MDVVLISRDRKQFHAHRLILSKRSPVFQAMLRSDMKERISGKIHSEDFSGKCLKLLVHFLYTGCLEKEWADSYVIYEVTYAADKYQLEDLWRLLDESLRIVCKPDDALKMLRLTNQISLKEAVKRLLQLVKKKFAKVKDTAGLFDLCMQLANQFKAPKDSWLILT